MVAIIYVPGKHYLRIKPLSAINMKATKLTMTNRSRLTIRWDQFARLFYDFEQRVLFAMTLNSADEIANNADNSYSLTNKLAYVLFGDIKFNGG